MNDETDFSRLSLKELLSPLLMTGILRAAGRFFKVSNSIPGNNIRSKLISLVNPSHFRDIVQTQTKLGPATELRSEFSIHETLFNV